MVYSFLKKLLEPIYYAPKNTKLQLFETKLFCFLIVAYNRIKKS